MNRTTLIGMFLAVAGATGFAQEVVNDIDPYRYRLGQPFAAGRLLAEGGQVTCRWYAYPNPDGEFGYWLRMYAANGTFVFGVTGNRRIDDGRPLFSWTQNEPTTHGVETRPEPSGTEWAAHWVPRFAGELLLDVDLLEAIEDGITQIGIYDRVTYEAFPTVSSANWQPVEGEWTAGTMVIDEVDPVAFNRVLNGGGGGGINLLDEHGETVEPRRP